MGHEDENPDEPFVLVPPSPVDHRVLAGPVDKDRREDLQLWGWLQALAVHGALRHPVSVGPGGDPPDRFVEVDGTAHAVELTQLTVQDLRVQLARVRQVGRAVEERLAANPAVYKHLTGRMVTLADVSPEAPGLNRTLESTTGEIAAALAQDRGYVGLGVDLSDGFPEQWSNSNGFYGEVAGFIVQVNLDPGLSGGAPVQVAASSQGRFTLSEARSLLWARVASKDEARNRVLIVTTGLMDQAGYVCPLDRWLFLSLAEHGVGEMPREPIHLDAVVLHHFTTNDVLVAYQRPGAALPWRS